jgi:hypothetical protein
MGIGYDGFTMMSLDEMKRLIEGIQAMIDVKGVVL